MQAESLEILTRPGDNTGVGTRAVLLDNTGIHLANGAKLYDVDGYIDTQTFTQQLLATSVDQNIWTVPEGTWKVVKVTEVHSVAGGSSAAVDVKVATGTDAPASGTTQLGAAIDLTVTANTVQTPALISSPTAMGPGARLCLDMSGTLTALVGTISVKVGRLT